METPGNNERTQIAVYKEYYSEFSLLDWAFTILAILNIAALVFTYFKRAKVVDFISGFQSELPKFTNIALSSWFLPLVVIFPIVLLIYTLNPRTPLVNRGRHILILTVFLINLVGTSAFVYALKLPFQNGMPMVAPAKAASEVEPQREAPVSHPAAKKKAPTHKRKR